MNTPASTAPRARAALACRFVLLSIRKPLSRRRTLSLLSIVATLILMQGAAWGQAALTRAAIITTVAGDPGAGSSCPVIGSVATATIVNEPYWVVVDRAGDQFVNVESCNAIYKVAAGTGIISLYAGTPGSQGSSGDGGPATSATLDFPYGLALDSNENLYIADYLANCVRKVTAATGMINTVAGVCAGGYPYYTGGSVPATSAPIEEAASVFVDAQNNIYIGTISSQVVKVTASTGNMSLFAGTGTSGYSGDGGPATGAKITSIYGLVGDSAGNIYLSDYGNERIRKVSALTGVITTVAGNGTVGYAGDNGLATSAELDGPSGIALDSSGNLYITDYGNSVIREVSISSGVIITVVGDHALGSGFSGNGGLATSAQMNQPYNVALDTLGNLYISEYGNSDIRKVNPTGGTLLFPPTPIGATSAAVNLVLRVNTGSLTISSFTAPASVGNQQEYAITGNNCALNSALPNGTLCTLTITFSPQYVGVRPVPLVAATSAGTFNFGMQGVGTEPLAALTPGTISTIAGTGTAGYGGDGGAATGATLHTPSSVISDYAGNLYFSDTGNNRVRRIDAVTGALTTIAGTGTAGFSGDSGAATAAQLAAPQGLALDAANDLFIVDSGNSAVREVNADTGFISTVAGTGGSAGYSGDGGLATSAQLNSPAAVVVDTSGNLYIADSSNNVIRWVNTAGVINTIAGSNTSGYSGDGGPATSAQLDDPQGLVEDAAGDLYFADSGNSVVREINLSGVISTVAGNGTAGFTGDGGAATSAQLNNPSGLGIDAAGNLYLSDTGNQRIRKLELASGIITTVAGAGTAGYTGDAGSATAATLNTPAGLGLGANGNLLIADSHNNVLRQVAVQSGSLDFASTVIGATSVDSPRLALFSNIGNSSLTIAVPTTGANPTSPSNGFSIGNSSTCPQLTSGSAAATLAAGTSCSLQIGFAPTAVGSLNSTVSITDDSGNAASAVQSLGLSGTGTPVATTITVAAGTDVYGQTTVSATIAPVSGVALPVGSVVFTIDGVAETAVPVNGSGVATLPAAIANALSGGSHTITAAYTSTSVDFGNSSSGSVSFTVAPVTPVVTATISPANPVYGQTATVTISDFAGGIPQAGSTETVTVGSQTYTCTTTALGTCNVTIPGGVLQTGSDTVAVSTPATANASAGQASLPVTVAAAPPVVTASISPANPAYGQAVTITVTDTAAGIPQPGSTGTVTVDGQTYTCTTSAAGTCTVTIPGGVLQGGSDNIAVTASATANASAGSAAVTVAVSPAAVSLALTSSAPSITVGNSVTFTATGTASAVPVVTGTVTFASNGTTLGVVTLTNGFATLTTTNLAAGTDTITAAYAASPDFSAATAPQLIETVLVPSFNLAVASSASSTATVENGGTASFPLTLGVINGFAGTLTMSASGLPPGATATFNPPTVTLNGTTPGSTTLTIVTPQTPPTTASSRQILGGTFGIQYGFLLLPVFAFRRVRKQLRKSGAVTLLAMMSFGAMAMALTGCGGYVGTSAKTYVITVTATSGQQQQSTTVTLTVK